jgi:pyridoxamine 5'-phosphate oxidase-like protein
VKPAILQTYRKDGRAHVTPVWFREHDGAYEVIADGDPKLAHLRRDPRCTFLAFDVEPPFRGVRVEGDAELVECEVTPYRAAIAGRYLGEEAGRRFAEQRRATPGVLVRLTGRPHRWDLSQLLRGP